MAKRVPISEVCGCFPTGRYYAGIQAQMAKTLHLVKGLAKVLAPDAKWHDAPLAIIDFETTGFDPKDDRIIELGVACFEGGKLVKKDNWFANPRRPIPDEVIEITGILREDVNSAPPLEDVIGEFEAFIDGYIPVAYNAVFDQGFLLAEAKRLGYEAADTCPAFDPDIVWLDPLVWVREQQKEKSRKLGDVCKRLGIPLEKAHRAAEDAEAAGWVLMYIAKHLPALYGELVRLQGQYAARQEVDMAARRANWKK